MWTYNGQIIDCLKKIPEGAIGMIYFIICKSTGRYYVGKKQFYTNRRAKITQKEKLESGNNRKKFKQIVKESDWLTYNSSCAELKKDIKECPDDFVKEILQFCFDKRELNYREVWHQFDLDVLENNTYNGNIASRWFKKKEEV